MVISTERPRIHLDMFKPAEPGNYPANIVELGDRFFGREAGVLLEVIRRGKERWDIDHVKAQIDGYALARFGSVFNLPDPSFAPGFYLKQLKSANGVIGYINGIGMPSKTQNFSLLSEVGLSDRPSDGIEWLAYASINGHRRLFYETTRQLLLAAVSAGIHTRNRKARIETTATSIKRVLSEDFYEKPDADPYTVYSLHDDETNKTLSAGYEEIKTPVGTHLKTRELYLRTVPGIGRVMVTDRTKDKPAAILKAIADARDNGGWIHPEDVQDTMGMRFIVMEPEEGDKKVELLQGRFIDHLRSANNARKILGRLIGFIPDDMTASGRNGSANYQHSRLQTIIEGESGQVQFEVIFQNAIQGFDGEYMVGERNSETGLYNGAAYSIYRIQRIMNELPILYPPEIYGKGPMVAVSKRLEEVVANLKESDRIN